jgi:hypothetical protein
VVVVSVNDRGAGKVHCVSEREYPKKKALCPIRARERCKKKGTKNEGL